MAGEQASGAGVAVAQVWVCYSLEAVRWIGGISGFALALASSDSPAEMIHIFAPFLLLSLAGTSGLEDVVFWRCAPTISGSEPNVYQRHFGFSNLALAGAGLLSFLQNWGPAADVALLTVLLASTSLSAISHSRGALAGRTLRLRSLIRATGTVGLLMVVLPMLIPVAQNLG